MTSKILKFPSPCEHLHLVIRNTTSSPDYKVDDEVVVNMYNTAWFRTKVTHVEDGLVSISLRMSNDHEEFTRIDFPLPNNHIRLATAYEPNTAVEVNVEGNWVPGCVVYNVSTSVLNPDPFRVIVSHAHNGQLCQAWLTLPRDNDLIRIP
jgi:hypothetical protein